MRRAWLPRNAAGLVVQAHDEVRRFFRLTEEHPALLSVPWRLLICFSYYCACDLFLKVSLFDRKKKLAS